jgi:hypothetical protein
MMIRQARVVDEKMGDEWGGAGAEKEMGVVYSRGPR